MKRPLALLLSVCLLCSCLAGCGSSKTAEGYTETRTAFHNNGSFYFDATFAFSGDMGEMWGTDQYTVSGNVDIPNQRMAIYHDGGADYLDGYTHYYADGSTAEDVFWLWDCLSSDTLFTLMLDACANSAKYEEEDGQYTMSLSSKEMKKLGKYLAKNYETYVSACPVEVLSEDELKSLGDTSYAFASSLTSDKLVLQLAARDIIVKATVIPDMTAIEIPDGTTQPEVTAPTFSMSIKAADTTRRTAVQALLAEGQSASDIAANVANNGVEGYDILNTALDGSDVAVSLVGDKNNYHLIYELAFEPVTVRYGLCLYGQDYASGVEAYVKLLSDNGYTINSGDLSAFLGAGMPVMEALTEVRPTGGPAMGLYHTTFDNMPAIVIYMIDTGEDMSVVENMNENEDYGDEPVVVETKRTGLEDITIEAADTRFYSRLVKFSDDYNNTELDLDKRLEAYDNFTEYFNGVLNDLGMSVVHYAGAEGTIFHGTVGYNNTVTVIGHCASSIFGRNVECNMYVIDSGAVASTVSTYCTALSRLGYTVDKDRLTDFVVDLFSRREELFKTSNGGYVIPYASNPGFTAYINEDLGGHVYVELRMKETSL